MHIKKNKLILFIILISITDFSFAEKAPFESTYEALPPTNTIFRNANVYDGEGNEFSEIDLLIKDGKIIAMGSDLPGSSEFIEVDAGGSVGVAIQQPRFLCRTDDVSSATEGDAITILGVAYTIRIVQDDGTGMTTFVLEKN